MSALRRTVATLVIGVLLLSCSDQSTSPVVDSPLQPSFAVVANFREFVPVDFFLFPPCNGEPTESHGTVHIVVSETVTPSGRVNWRFHVNANGTGVGLTTGAKYQWNDALNQGFSVDATDGLPYTATVVQRIRLIGQGQVPDGYFDLLFHITINANGEVPAFKFEVSPECT